MKTILLMFSTMIILSGCQTSTGNITDNESNTPVNTDVKEVVAVGVGKTPEDARKQAFFSAVEQVVGALVDAKINVKDNEVIQEQILTLSDGYIEDFVVVEPARMVDGAYQETLRAKVKRTRLLSKLSDDHVALKSAVRGELLFAQALTQGRVRDQAVEIVTALLADDPLDYKVEVVSSAKRLDLFSLTERQLLLGENWLTMRLRVSVDSQNLSNNIAPKLRRTLDAVLEGQHLKVKKRGNIGDAQNIDAGVFFSPAYNSYIYYFIYDDKVMLRNNTFTSRGRSYHAPIPTYDKINSPRQYISLYDPFLRSLYTHSSKQSPLYISRDPQQLLSGDWNFAIVADSGSEFIVDLYSLPPALVGVINSAQHIMPRKSVIAVSLEMIDRNGNRLANSEINIPRSGGISGGRLMERSGGMAPALQMGTQYNLIAPAFVRDDGQSYVYDVEFDVLIPVSIETLNALKEVKVTVKK